MKNSQLLRGLRESAVDVSEVLAPDEGLRPLEAISAAALLAFRAQAVSIAAVDADRLRYIAAAGVGRDEIVGAELSHGTGLAGYVVATGQSLAVDRPVDDPRFARDVAERTAFVPSSMLVVPITAPAGETLGVLSVLDREVGAADALVLATAFAALAAMLLPSLDAAGRGARLLLGALVQAVHHGDASLGDALRRAVEPLPPADADIVRMARVFERLRTVDQATRTRIVGAVAELVDVATARGRR